MWRALFLSLALDSVVVVYLNKTLPVEPAQIAACIAAICTLPFLNQAGLAKALTTTRRLQSDSKRSPRLNQRAAIALIIIVTALAKLSLLPKLNSFVAIVVATIVVLGIVSSMRHMIRQHRERALILDRSPLLQIVLWERQMVLLFTIPMLLARIISLCGALSLGNASSPAFAAGGFVTSTILLAALKPNRSAFIGWCPQCRSPAPSAFVEYGSCPQCNEKLAGDS
jgi:hypothetical protein